MTYTKLTLDQGCALADVVRAAQGKDKVFRMVGGDPERVLYGTARAIVNPNDEAFPSFNRGEQGYDIRECRLWVTLSTGFEAFWVIGELIDEVAAGTASMVAD